MFFARQFLLVHTFCDINPFQTCLHNRSPGPELSHGPVLPTGEHVAALVEVLPTNSRRDQHCASLHPREAPDTPKGVGFLPNRQCARRLALQGWNRESFPLLRTRILRADLVIPSTTAQDLIAIRVHDPAHPTGVHTFLDDNGYHTAKLSPPWSGIPTSVTG